MPADRGAGSVAAMAVERRGHLPELSPDVFERPQLQGETLTRADTVRLAVTHNPELRKLYADLGIASADVLQAGRLSNPNFSASIMTSSESGMANQLTFGLAQNFADLLLMPSRRRISEGQLERTKTEVAAAILDLIARTEAAFYRLAAAREIARLRELQERASGLSSELAGRFREAGNISALALHLEQAAASEARLAAVDARMLVEEARFELNRLMGLHASEAVWSVEQGLALPVVAEDDPNEILILAHEQRLELVSVRRELDLLAEGVTLARRYRYIGEAELGVEFERETDRSRLFGPFISLSLPLFNQNQGAILRSDARLEAGLARLDALEIATGNEVYLAHQRVLGAREKVFEYRDVLVPSRVDIVERTQERVNFMLDDVFDLIRAKQQEYDAYHGYVEAVRDYWIARTELARLVGTELPSGLRFKKELIRLPELIDPDEAAEHDHSEHDHDEPDHEHHAPEPENHEHHHHGGH
ncbi:TolC family protein [Desulfonatronum thiosulfatophilum]|uniref:TolC family protein n=1 Tax=Desulfonatronum thiosulfatophilum TaxID=617002 RepID=UPI00137A2DAC|nr:TolC family protein [Desulfonatronum thiosulfatophilum]